MKRMKKRRLLSLLLAAVMAAGLAGCAPGQIANLLLSAGTRSAQDKLSETAEEKTDQPDETAQPSAPQAAEPAPLPAAATLPGLLGELPVLYDETLTPSVPAFTVESDFSDVINAGDMDYWPQEARDKLLQNGFLVVPGTGDEFFSRYEMNRYGYIPNFITVDSSLHTYHLYFLYLQKQTERNELGPALLELSRTMQQTAQAQLDALAGTEWENAARRTLAFFTVGLCLQDPAAAVPEAVAEPVAAELALIEAADTTAASPVMNLGGDPAAALMEDYTQYIPRSYYAGEEGLERYFRAMMWYGRLTFRAADEDASRSALLACLALQTAGGARETWERLYAVTSFFAGASDDACFADYAPVIEQAYGGWPEAAALPQQPDAFAAYTAALAELAPGAVNSMPVFEWEDRDAATAGFRFMGQRFTLDAAVVQQLIYRDVEQAADGSRRMLPEALDLPAALGSDTALAILNEQGEDKYPNYGEQMETVRAQLDSAPAATWTASLYAAWLDTLRPLLQPKGEGWPQYMQTEAWAKRSLASFLGSWAELKHDTALYAKQVYGEMGGGPIDAAAARGYVEAEPAVFGKLAALCQATAEGLDALGLLSEADAENLGRLYTLNEQLMTIAEKELRGELPTDEEFELIRSYGGQLEHFWTQTVQDEEAGIYTPQQMPAALVADIATDPNGTVRQVGTGVGTIYVLVEVDGSIRLASGTVFDFYQLDVPSSDRMTDQDWWALLSGYEQGEDGQYHSTRPDQPAWTDAYTGALY